MEREVKRIGITEILGKEIEFYNNWEEPLFIARSVAEWIDYNISNVSKLVNNVDDEEKSTRTYITSEGNSTTAWFLTEDGLYETLMQSRKPIAKDLKKQIKQYLKQIRITGGAVEEGREEEFIDKYFPSFSEEVKLSMVQDLLKTNKELKPKAEYYDKVLDNSKLKTTTDIAKDLGMSAQKLNKLLDEKGIIYPKKIKDKKTDKMKIVGWYLHAEYDYLIPEYADYKITEYGQSLGWYEKGREYIIELLK